MNKEPDHITVRFVEDLGTGKGWFEEKLSDGQYVKISCTETISEANSRYRLEQEIERRRQKRIAIYRNYGAEETHSID